MEREGKRTRKPSNQGVRADDEVQEGTLRPPRRHAGPEGRPVSRVEAFAQVARRRSEGEPVFLPIQQRGNARRAHVRQTLREDHQTRITDNAKGAQRKFRKLKKSRFSFFRGTALLFYRDLAGEDA